MKRSDFLSSKQFKRKFQVPFMAWGEGSPNLYTLKVVYDIGPGTFFEGREDTYYNAIGLDGYPTSFGSMNNFREHPHRPAPSWDHKAEELYVIAKEKCKALGYDISRLP